MELTIKAVDSHTMGEPTRVVVGGLPAIPGNTMAEKKAYLEQNLDYVRTALMHEPRGHRDMFGSIITEPCNPEADMGIVFMHSGSFLNMCGHGSIGAASIAVETGMVKVTEPETIVKLDSPSGLVEARVRVSGGKAEEVTIQNVPAFMFGEGMSVETPSSGKVTFDISFGGSFFALVDVKEFGLSVETEHINALVSKAMELQEVINKKIKVYHPERPHIKAVELVEIYEKRQDGYKNVVVFGAGQFDRSPCGTGTSAKMAVLYKKGELKLGEDFVYRSIIDTAFTGRLIGVTRVGEFDAVIPEITGKAFITGFNNYVLDERDPLKYGFLV
ncbi:MAG: Proline racemase [Firmicutes bacterium]|nr:Proline racemase [Bacillota bacterium]MDI6704917.1 proline racemase family protein [Bacillota bacterium]